MNLQLEKSSIKKQTAIQVTGSKSETNRLLLLQALYPNIEIKNISNSDDSQLMTKALASKNKVVDIHHAGTAMRFLTAFFALKQDRETILTGSKRMKERPIKILVDALNQLGAKITYQENEGYPPILIKGKKLTKHQVALSADVSSQYISALLLIASKLENGIELALKGKITSVPYIKMTLSLLNQIGIETQFENNKITVKPKNETQTVKKSLTVESDWSSASYFYSIVALSNVGTIIELASYKENSLQGDSALAKLYESFGVTTTFKNTTIILEKTKVISKNAIINFDLANAPDIAQTIAVSAFALGLKCDLTGLHTLKIKETDRLEALKTEIEKLGGTVNVTNNSLHLTAATSIKNDISISTYNDHRMAMAFAPLALKVPIEIEDYMVVSKSYPTFWEDLKSLGFQNKA
ncbi:3-phosphoshikimate 1-carboxyvinyltransferase [Lacinutrix sp. 5H-3-7-4]|uniref:3-phosphoshikimate 1-carboxyvinyltransferase n=1 Tax=Lacinutrix sp. (strain 5H-3-7-4) TaxID=983544 RepID=UPI00020A36F6|nr:3-phosphoshikimate 1-carboxyvinyltransferase [Lacinutrix sp. 5H-3-7-4]AEH00303.1 3-phosphoshikimate 1-carboxyvinyltransferase [Lacinutrix sp. 5H-3-7-4]